MNNIIKVYKKCTNKKTKFYVKSSLIIFVIFERIINILTQILIGYLLVVLFRGNLNNSIETYLRIISILLIDLLGFWIYRIREIRFRKAKKYWDRILPKSSQTTHNKIRKLYYFYISNINDYSKYGNILLITFILISLIIFSKNMRIAILIWITNCVISYLAIKNYLKILNRFNLKNKLNFLYLIYIFVLKNLKINKYQMLNSYLLLTLVICFILFPPNTINILEILIAVFGFRQVLSSIRSFLYIEGNKAINV